jgi:hypothetical protein
VARVVNPDAGFLSARVDGQLGEDVPQVAVHRVGRQEETARDLAVRDSIRDEPRYLRLGSGQGREADAVDDYVRDAGDQITSSRGPEVATS